MGRKFSSSNFFKDDLTDQRLSSDAQKRAMQVSKSVSRWIDTLSQFGLDAKMVKGYTSIDKGIYVEWVYMAL
ncbi:MAG: hypothetical protein OXK17_10380 [Thaumarchaeota archaeon]|nr:hypothetical protein [Nitrososphaerota archaeon]